MGLVGQFVPRYFSELAKLSKLGKVGSQACRLGRAAEECLTEGALKSFDARIGTRYSEFPTEQHTTTPCSLVFSHME